MNRRLASFIAVVTIVLGAAIARAQDEAQTPAPDPAAAATMQPADAETPAPCDTATEKPADAATPKPADDGKATEPEAPPAADPEVDRILRLAEAAGDKINKLAANFDYDEYESLLEDREFYEGRIVYRKPNRVFMEFTKGSKQSFRFDGRVFVDDRPQQKVRHVYTIRKPTEPEVEDLDVDKVPFPLPFGQKRDKVLRSFDVKYDGKQPLGPWAGTSERAKETDKKECEKLTLVPKPQGPLARDYKKMEFWVDPESGIPAQVRMVDKSDRILTVRFSKIETNDKVDAPDRTFEEQPLPSGWDRFTHE